MLDRSTYAALGEARIFEPASLQKALRERKRQCVAHGKRERRRCGRRKVERARLGQVAEVDVHRARPREARLRLARHADGRNAIHPQDRRERDDLLRLARPGKEQDNVVRTNRPEIAVHRLGRVDEMRRLSEARKRR